MSEYGKRFLEEANPLARNMFWELLHPKALYYTLATSVISDMEYDLFEKEYEKLSGLDNVVGFNVYDPIARNILRLDAGVIKDKVSEMVLNRRK